MATTYLDLTNEVLRELNEIPLTSANFANAVGFQKFVKDAINKSIFDIANQEPQLPFFSSSHATIHHRFSHFFHLFLHFIFFIIVTRS